MANTNYFRLSKNVHPSLKQREDGAKEYGFFKDDLLQGWGVRQSENTLERGSFQQGKLHGIGFRIDSKTTEIQIGIFVEGSHIPDAEFFKELPDITYYGAGKDRQESRCFHGKNPKIPAKVTKIDFVNAISYSFDKPSESDGFWVYRKDGECFLDYSGIENASLTEEEISLLCEGQI